MGWTGVLFASLYFQIFTLTNKIEVQIEIALLYRCSFKVRSKVLNFCLKTITLLISKWRTEQEMQAGSGTSANDL